jgi:hypothetical protein
MVKNTGEYRITLTFPDKSCAQQGQFADELKAFLERRGTAIATPEVTKDRTDTQDLGTIVTVIVSSTALSQLVKGVFDFAQKKASHIEIAGPKGSVIASGDSASGIDVARVTEAVVGTPEAHR